MLQVDVKRWIYQEAQTRAQKYNWTLLWNHIDEHVFALYGDITRETEKAVLLECKYWNLNRAGRYATDAPVCEGFKVWIPKTAIVDTRACGCYRIMDYDRV